MAYTSRDGISQPKKGLVVDLETTGLDSDQDQIIEIGLLGFEWKDDQLPLMTMSYGGLEEFGGVLDPEVEQLTGLTTDLLNGKHIDWSLVRNWLLDADLVVAHNAPFDHGFLSGRPELADLKKEWACSLRHIDWSSHGYKTRSLNYLAADCGFINPFPHRAVFDCATTFKLISPHLSELVRRSAMPITLIKAIGAPFEVKDSLKERGYRWVPEERSWQRLLFSDSLVGEREWLESAIYRGNNSASEESYELFKSPSSTSK